MIIFFTILISFILAFWSINFSIPFFKKYFLDIPNVRSSHKISKPTGFGIIFILIGMIFSLFFKEYSIILLLPLSIIGFIDDKYNVPRKIRYLVQLLSSISFILLTDFGRDFYSSIMSEFFILNIAIFFLLVIFFTSIINFMNFMDGLDGLVSGCMLVFLSISTILNFHFLAGFIGSLLAFFIWNWHPSKIFMGDSGSTALGGLFVLVLLMNDNIFDIFGLLLVGTPLFADSFICVLRRLFYRLDIFTPHKLHLYQRLNLAGWNQSDISKIYILSTIILGINFLISRDILLMVFLSSIIVLIGFLLDHYKAKPFINCI